jgi:hypothetical protein
LNLRSELVLGEHPLMRANDTPEDLFRGRNG